MTIATLRLTLDNERAAYLPGETLAGEYQVAPAESGDVQAVEISVLWYTEGKGDEDMAVHYFERVTNDSSAFVDYSLPRRFSTVLPDSPLSYDGVLVKIHWCVRVRLFFNRGKPMVEERWFRLGDIPPARAVLP